MFIVYQNLLYPNHKVNKKVMEKIYILSIVFLSVYSMQEQQSLEKLTATEQINGYLKNESWKGLGWSTVALALIYGVKKCSNKLTFLENHKKFNLLTAGIFFAPQIFNIKKYKQIAETTKIDNLKINKYYFFGPNPSRILTQRLRKNYKTATNILSEMDAERAAEILSEIDMETAKNILSEMDTVRAAEILSKMHPSRTAEILSNMWYASTAGKILDILSQSNTNRAAEILTHIHVHRAKAILNEVNIDRAAEILDILSQPNTKRAAEILSEIDIQKAGMILDRLIQKNKVRASEIFNQLDQEAGALWRLIEMDTKNAKEILNEVNIDKVTVILTKMEKKELQDVLNRLMHININIIKQIFSQMKTNEAAKILSKMDSNRQSEILKISNQLKNKIKIN